MYEPFICANTSFSKIWSINCIRNGFMFLFKSKMSKFIPLSLRLSGIEFSLIWDLGEEGRGAYCGIYTSHKLRRNAQLA
jgi:hypothetical protein